MGYNEGQKIEKSYATGNVNGTDSLGGLIGLGVDRSNDDVSEMYDGEINSYATGDVNGTSRIGGLTGDGGNVTNSYATGDVNGTYFVGGLTSYVEGSANYFGGSINSYATGDVTGNKNVGGLAGINTGQINKSYTVSDVSGDSNIGGLVGQNGDKTGFSSGDPSDGILKDVYWNKDVSVNNAIGKKGGDDTDSYSGSDSITRGDVMGLKTVEMQGANAETNMDSLDFGNNWTTVPSNYPELQD